MAKGTLIRLNPIVGNGRTGIRCLFPQGSTRAVHGAEDPAPQLSRVSPQKSRTRTAATQPLRLPAAKRRRVAATTTVPGVANRREGKGFNRRTSG